MPQKQSLASCALTATPAALVTNAIPTEPAASIAPIPGSAKLLRPTNTPPKVALLRASPTAPVVSTF